MADIPAYSSRFRDFDAEYTEVAGEPITFKLGGRIFHCVNPVPVGSMVVMLRHVSDEQSVERNAAMINLLWSWVEPDEHAALDEVMSKVTDPALFERLTEFIVTEASGRPTPAP